MFGKFIKSAKKVQNQNLLEAIIAGSMLVAAASGEIQKVEMEKLDKLLVSNENLSAFKPADIRKIISRYQNILEADFGVGQMKMMKELADISDNTDHCEEVFLNMLAIAKADGSIDEPEKTVMAKVARSLGISLDEYSLS